jgi:hypothetical protein
VKVFISSVRYLLKDERNNLPPFLDVMGHRGLRFEDFAAPDASSREACLAGVVAADVYVLLLGPKYGDPFPDTGLAPTHEEFAAARNRGIPILVFTKNTAEPDEPAQEEFKKEVGHYVNGRFWKSFDDPMSLNIAVGKALNDLKLPAAAFRLLPVAHSRAVSWLDHSSGLRPREVDAPVLELHLIPTAVGGPTGASALASAAASLEAELRRTGFVPNSDPLQSSSTNDRAWAARPPGIKRHRTASAMGWSEEAWRGAAVAADGTATAWVSLSTDFLGTLVDQASLRRHVLSMLAVAAPHVGDSDAIAVACRLSPAGNVNEGDPSRIGQQNSGGMRMREVDIVIEPTFAVARDHLNAAAGELAAEIATRLLNDVRQLPAY